MTTTVLVYCVISVLALAPLILVAIAATIATAKGIELDEAHASQCIVCGRDIGPMLTRMFVCGWFGLVTLPAGVVALVGWTLYVLLR